MASSDGILTAPFKQLAVLTTARRELAWEVAKREIAERYTGAMLGTFWALAHPLFLIGLYVFVFAVVLDLRTGGAAAGREGSYPIYLLAGLIPWMAFQETMTRACAALTGSAALVKQVVFPIEVLPVKSSAPAVLNQLIATALFLAYVLATSNRLPATALLLPLLLAIQWLAMLGAAYALSALTVFVRDTRDVVQLFSIAGVYLIPVFYLPAWLPDTARVLVTLNPFSHMVWCYQDALHAGRFDHPASWLVFPICSLASFILGFALFRTLKPMYGNAL
jgi:lipopolysaccharide transport system permease protein